MIEFLSGVVTCGYAVAAGLFFHQWRRTGDALFRAFTAAFALFALNQVLAAGLVTPTEPSSLIYSLRILGFVLLLGALVDRNPFARGSPDARLTHGVGSKSLRPDDGA